MNGSLLRMADADGLAVLVDAHRRVLAARGNLVRTGVPTTVHTLIASAGACGWIVPHRPDRRKIRIQRARLLRSNSVQG